MARTSATQSTLNRSTNICAFSNAIFFLQDEPSTRRGGPRSKAPTTSTTRGASKSCRCVILLAQFFCQGAHGRHGNSSCHDEQVKDDDDTDTDVSEDNDDGQESQVCRRKGTRACKFCHEDLPGLLGSMVVWCEVFLLCWFQYLSTIDNIWKLDHPEHIVIAQAIWDRKVKVKHVVATRGEPVFFLVSCLLILTITDLTCS